MNIRKETQKGAKERFVRTNRRTNEQTREERTHKVKKKRTRERLKDMSEDIPKTNIYLIYVP